MYVLINLYLLKFSTDVLLIAPAVMGTIFGISRVWDAVSDPLVGYLSDRTKARIGRRRSWLLASIVPVWGMFVWVFSPPDLLSGGYLEAWMAIGVVGFYSAVTALVVPHMALGAELTTNYHDRSRLYGFRHSAYHVGAILALASVYQLIAVEGQGASGVRVTAFQLSMLAGFVASILVACAVYVLRERHSHRVRVNERPGKAFMDVWRNVHARLVLVVTFIEHIGFAAIGVLTLYVAQYVIGRPELAAAIILAYMVPSSLTVPLWVPLSRRFGKIRLWLFSMVVTAFSFGLMVVLPFLEPNSKLWLILGLVFTAGCAAGCGGAIGPSVQSDIIDSDEYQTGERKEGSYFAAFNFANKSASGVMVVVAGFVLQAAGFVPNEPQTMTVQVAIVALFGLVPLICYLVGAWLFSHFTLDEAAHEALRESLDRRAEA